MTVLSEMTKAKGWMLLVGLARLLATAVASNETFNLDRFNYNSTVGNDYGPSDWIQVRCTDVGDCEGWPDDFRMAIDWELSENSCEWCPADDDGACGMHHQSPIDLKRNRAIEGHPDYNECIDVHWMAYRDSTCDFEILQNKGAFSIERHALKIAQPLEEFQPNTFRLACRNSLGRRWGKIDFSRGFSQWWHLSHTDFHVPSEHTQEGKRYAGEIQMYHWYSVNATVAGIHNEMASVTVFLEDSETYPDYDFLNRVICEWRMVEEKTREQCELPSVATEYPGCIFPRRGHTTTTRSRRHLRPESSGPTQETRSQPVVTAHDLLLRNLRNQYLGYDVEPATIELEPEEEDFVDDLDWDAFIASQYDDANNHDENHRSLINYRHVGPWFNYFPMLGVRTEYYYRYSGTQTVPPCYGRWFAGNNRRQTNHWRIMKDPIRVSTRQIREMHRLLKERIAPRDDPLNACENDTGAKIDPSNPEKVSVARPLQSTRPVHFKVFCECEDWDSKWAEDRAWCRKDKLERFYEHPYNYETTGF